MRQLCIGIVLAVCSFALHSTALAAANEDTKARIYAESYGKFSKQEAAAARKEKRLKRVAQRQKNVKLREERRLQNARLREERRLRNAKLREERRLERASRVAKRKAAIAERKRIREEQQLARENRANEAQANTRPNSVAVQSRPAPVAPAANEPVLVRPPVTTAAIVEPAVTRPAVVRPPVTNPAVVSPPVTTPAVVRPPVTSPVVSSAPTVGRATVRWSVPSQREDGSRLAASEIQGYEIYVTSGGLTTANTIRITNSRQTEYRFDDLISDDYHFSMVTIDSNGTYSELSPVVSKSIN